MIEVKWVGRGGYGVVTVSDILAKAAVVEGKHSQHIPMFGPERAGAPVYAFTRISEEPIELHSGVYSPDIVIIIDPKMSTEDTVIRNTGLKRDGTLLLNTKSIPSDIVEIAQENNYTLYHVDAYTIAMDIFKRPFYNTPMLGALVKATGIVKLESILKVIETRFKGKVVEMNIEAIKRAYEEVRKHE